MFQLKLRHEKTGKEYEFVHGGWVTLDSDHDSWTEVPVEVEEDKKEEKLKLCKYSVEVGRLATIILTIHLISIVLTARKPEI